ncbi:MAG: hemolysin family protein [Planctomycetota bacterium]
MPPLDAPILQWTALDIWLLAFCGLLIIGSAFFSGSETALFGISQSQRRAMNRRRPRLARIVDALLNNQRMLLITVMLGNMTINSLYFVIGSVLMMRSGDSATIELLIGLSFLLVIVLFGEVMPKMLATSHRTIYLSIVGPPLLAIHRLNTPLRVAVDTCIVTPLNRLTAPSERPPELNEAELKSLLDVSGEQGVIDEDEQRLLREVLEISRRKVRDVMTPRVRMLAIPDDATADDVRAILAEKRLTKLPVFHEDLDSIVGVLHVKRFLLASERSTVSVRAFMSPPQYVPVMANLEQLYVHFQSSHTQSAIVVDEYGGTEGIVSVEDAVEELVGDVDRDLPASITGARLVGLGTWEIDGDMSVHDWADAFGTEHVPMPVATVGGLITHSLGRAAVEGDLVRIGNMELMVNDVDGTRISTVLVRLQDPIEPEDLLEDDA